MENLGIEDPDGKLDETKLEKEFVPVPIHSTILNKYVSTTKMIRKSKKEMVIGKTHLSGRKY